MNIFDTGVQLPTDGFWVDIPNSPFQVCAALSDPLGSFKIRISPQWRNHWDAWLDETDWHGPDALS